MEFSPPSIPPHLPYPRSSPFHSRRHFSIPPYDGLRQARQLLYEVMWLCGLREKPIGNVHRLHTLIFPFSLSLSPPPPPQAINVRQLWRGRGKEGIVTYRFILCTGCWLFLCQLWGDFRHRLSLCMYTYTNISNPAINAYIWYVQQPHWGYPRTQTINSGNRTRFDVSFFFCLIW